MIVKPSHQLTNYGESYLHLTMGHRGSPPSLSFFVSLNLQDTTAVRISRPSGCFCTDRVLNGPQRHHSVKIVYSLRKCPPHVIHPEVRSNALVIVLIVVLVLSPHLRPHVSTTPPLSDDQKVPRSQKPEGGELI